ncbi:electron transport complex subunit RsxD [Aliivibrio fischeri]|uniref:electron transport complex subunit RsxD n=1 Tax=Aliivibrio fischeri TaxID=668 RepID=UPI0013117F1E|nr:electron transport complex subunit RsxD [Aliivibrio fischeri]MUK71253.1 electron transport complex subunit RsxD [Aliivibrio fischeri]MUK74548.1 electron transport complex subunit RsxD [Aliivibrio fischeri]MUK77443.1 electron transport complex subunit RsxD [Aliivibrio fischeri]MUL19797.1 electron transport complex subunit RsxD [Aliivibrio fischeri]
MAFFITSSPHAHSKKSTKHIMKMVALATIPGLLAQTYFFGWGNIIQVLIAIFTAIASEAIILKFRKRPLAPYLSDNSALLTGLLLALAIPPLAPWWVTVIGVVFAIVIAKHLYGGLGQNVFNPAMAAYVVLLISFPVQMTTWLPVKELLTENISLLDSLWLIFHGLSQDGFSVHQLTMNVDGMTMATPLDTIKTGLKSGLTTSEVLSLPIFNGFAGLGWLWVNVGFLLGGLFLLQQRLIHWHIPVSFLASLFIISSAFALFSPDTATSPLFNLFSGATMLGAFFIATDPVSAATTPKGRLYYGALIGALVYIIRTWGGFPDGVAFAVLLANMCVPLIDYYTKPRTYGHTKG